jgi:hypothetical protein
MNTETITKLAQEIVTSSNHISTRATLALAVTKVSSLFPSALYDYPSVIRELARRNNVTH